MRTEPSPFGLRPRRRQRRLSWKLSLVTLGVPLIALLATTGYIAFIRDERLHVTVIDAYTGRPLAGVRVRAGQQEVVTDEAGKARIETSGPSSLVLGKEDYDPITLDVTPDQRAITVRLRPNVVRGVVTSQATGEPLANVSVKALLGDQVMVQTITDVNGTYVLRGVPEGATLAFEHDEFADVRVELSRQTSISVALRPDVVTGQVTDLAGKPIEGATIAVGSAIATTDAAGSFRLTGAPERGDIVIKAPGYRARVVPLTADGEVLLVRQYRYSVGATLLEVPAGTLEPGESPLDCARRELAEEAGAAAERFEPLATLFPSPGVLTEVLHCYLATGLRLGTPQGTAEEDLTLVRLPLAEAVARVVAGEIRDAKSVASLLLTARRLGV